MKFYRKELWLQFGTVKSRLHKKYEQSFERNKQRCLKIINEEQKSNNFEKCVQLLYFEPTNSESNYKSAKLVEFKE